MDFYSKETWDFIIQHENEDLKALELKKRANPAINYYGAFQQLHGRALAKRKLPSWLDKDKLIYPYHLSLEQCSSEYTAQYKASLIKDKGESFADLTGGFGVDFVFLSSRFSSGYFVEKREELCDIARYNFPQLVSSAYTIFCKYGIEWLIEREDNSLDLIYIDPARRSQSGGKIIKISDCEPNVEEWQDLFLKKGKRVMIKLSPMLNIAEALKNLKHIQEIHIVSIFNECKEFLICIGKQNSSPSVSCVNLSKSMEWEVFSYPLASGGEKKETYYTSEIGNYLYEPNTSILKAGATDLLSKQFNLKKLHPNSHLFTGDEYLATFPGRKFKVSAVGRFNKRDIAALLGKEKRANLTVRNFPSSVEELRKRLKLREGGETFLFATTLYNGNKVLITTSKAFR